MPRLQRLCSTRFCQVAKLILAIGSLLTANALYAVSPTLIELEINDTPSLQLTTGEDYLLIIENANPHGTSFYFGEFAQGVLTQYLQGAASVSQDNIDVPANGKILWLFSPIKVGDFVYYAINGSSDQKGQKGKISVKLAEGANMPSPTQEPKVEAAVIPPSPETVSKDDSKEKLVVNEKRPWSRGGRRD